MAKRIKKDLNRLFGKQIVRNAVPDNYWVLPGEFIGFELECEDFEKVNETSAELEPEWACKPDMSLRNGIEWVLNGPHSGAGLRTAISKLFNGKRRYSMSERTSTHIHINMSDGLDLETLRIMTCIMYIIEPAVFRWADENRKWCSYCSPLTDMSPLRIATILNECDNDADLIAAFRTAKHEDKYYGFNLTSFYKHGTVEFRYFPCTSLERDAINWIQFVMEVKKAALSFGTMEEFLNTIADNDMLTRFMDNHFPVTGGYLKQYLDFDHAVWRSVKLNAMLDIKVQEIPGNRHKVVQRVPAESRGGKAMLDSLFPNRFAQAEQVVQKKPQNDGVAYDDVAAQHKLMYDHWNKKVEQAQDEQLRQQFIQLRNAFAR